MAKGRPGARGNARSTGTSKCGCNSVVCRGCSRLRLRWCYFLMASDSQSQSTSAALL